MRLLSSDMKLSSCTVGPILFLVTALSLSAENSTKTGNAKSLAAAESAFAQESLEKGTRTAFLHALCDDGLVFLPEPQNGKKAWEAKPEAGEGVLQWQPVLAATSTKSDLGYTTGPWTLKKNAADKEATAFGQFVSIWRWEYGKWKLLFDLGTDNPAPTQPAPELQLVDNHAPNEAAADAQPVMLAHDRRYAANRAQEFAGCAEENIRFYQPLKLPIIGKTEVAAALQHDASPIKFGEPKGGISRGGDLGYLWGEYTAGQATETTGYYLRIWRKDRAGAWKLALDLLHPR